MVLVNITDAKGYPVDSFIDYYEDNAVKPYRANLQGKVRFCDIGKIECLRRCDCNAEWVKSVVF